jgi:biotin carboxyl carrier protein
MKKYNIKVNGRLYEVEVEQTGQQGNVPIPPVSQPSVKEEQKVQAQVSAVSAETQGSVGSVRIESPMPGTILKVNVKVGDKVARGQVLCILEAMKMENEICASRDGTVASVNVSAGATVESGTLLVSIN